MPLGLYISIPFCRTKCSYCNFASDVFSRVVFERYVDRVCSDLLRAPETATEMGGEFERQVDSIYLGGGTPTLLDIKQLQRLFVTISQNFDLHRDAEITVECAPGTLSGEMIEALLSCRVNRVSLGVQSFVDREAAAVARLHKRSIVFEEIDRLRAAGISNINVDLIAGLPHQTAESWALSLGDVIASGVPHASVYMLEVDEDSRLGRELIAGGKKYHAHFVPNEDLTADFYLTACEKLDAAGVQQYEISNFARDGYGSRHNLKYWTRQPYFGFGVDAHSMLSSNCKSSGGKNLGVKSEAVRFAAPDSLEQYVAGKALTRTSVSRDEALEETFFLGLRLNAGVNLREVAERFGDDALSALAESIEEMVSGGLLERRGEVIRLTPRGRMVSNDVFGRFMVTTGSTS